MAGSALICAVAYCIVKFIDPYLLSWSCLDRPIVLAPIIGLLLGDFQTGIIMGASLEAIFMGISAIGGSVPSDAASASVIATAYAILAGGDMETGLALALPIGVIIAQVGSLFMTLWSALAPYWERLATSGKPNAFMAQSFFVSFLMQMPSTVILYLSIAFGVEGLQSALGKLPAFVMTGLGAASSMMVAVGLAILCSMIWSGRVGVFFFAGFVMAKILGMDSLSIAIIGITIAVTTFFNDKDFIDFKNTLSKKEAATGGGEEDFF